MEFQHTTGLPIHSVLSVGYGDNLESVIELAIAQAKAHPLAWRVVFEFNGIRFDITRESVLEKEIEVYLQKL